MSENIYLPGGSFSPCSRLDLILKHPDIGFPNDNSGVAAAREKIGNGEAGIVLSVREFTGILAIIIERIQASPELTSQLAYQYLQSVLSEIKPRNSRATLGVLREVMFDQGKIRIGEPIVMARSIVMPLVN